MPRNDLYARGRLRDDLGDVAREPLDAPAVVDVYEGKSRGEEVVAHVDNVRAGEEDDAVAVGVPVGEVYDAHLLAVEVDGDGRVVGDDGQPLFGERRILLAEHGRLHRQAAAHVRVRDDERLASEDGVGVRVVEVEVRVEDEAELPRRERLQGRAYLVGERRELVVHDEHTVRAGADADVAARAEEHVDAARGLLGLDLDLREVQLGLAVAVPPDGAAAVRGGLRGAERESEEDGCESPHKGSSSVGCGSFSP